MTARFRHHLLWPLVFAGAPALRAGTPVIGAQLFQETNDRIEELYGHRNTAPKPLGPPDNPFRPIDAPPPPAVVPAANGPATTDAAQIPAESADEGLLRQAYTKLTFGGVIELGGSTVVVINRTNYREGGLLTVRLQGAPVYLRIVALTRDSITLGLNEARLTLHF